jgi:hypothetical protein
MSHSSGAGPEHGLKGVLWFGIMAISLIVIALSFPAYWAEAKRDAKALAGHEEEAAKAQAGPAEKDSPEGTPLHKFMGDPFQLIAPALYNSVQLLALHAHEVPTGFDPQIHVAQVLSVLVLTSTVALTLFNLLQTKLRFVWNGFFGNHVVICGLGRNGLQLVKEFRDRNARAVSVEHHPDNENLTSAEEHGALIVIANPASGSVLRKAAVHRAKYLIAISEDDGVNVEIATRAGQLLRESKIASAANVQCFVHVVDLQLRRLFAQHRLFGANREGVRIKVFNIFENSARLLLGKYPIDPARLGPDDPRLVHLILFGFGQMGQSVALQAAKLGHYANGKNLKITVIDKAATLKKHGFYHDYPYFPEVCDVEFLDGSAEEAETLQKVREWTSEENSACTCVVCFDSDTRSLSFALKLLKTISAKAPIRVRMRANEGFASLLAAGAETANLPARFTPFGMVGDACAIEMVISEKLDALARAIHEDFVERRKREGRRPDENPSLAPWALLAEEFVDSNRQQADHVGVKLRAIGCYSAPMGSGEETRLTDTEIEVLAKMEHARWNAERRLAGWKFAPGEMNLEPKTSPYIVEWESLPDYVKEWDREAVRNIPKLLAANRKQICR